ncbi:universal stress protein [Kineosporia succinea]|uniref:Nucleotide-binding universal stress UspA family protein n=1 Tax=Kineosporia succinea TaxID=84632 RepID=A0ABT9PBU8_9ACTN|nr:universal stress protein [Kineosporia succinea]MDP9829874.1 nucleotide-binding universal stress UspA family protein [Kineosporia succinea]
MSIVLGYDESPAAHAALETAISLAGSLGERLVLVYGAGVPGQASEEMRSQRAALTEIGRSALDKAVARAQEAGVGTTTELIDARPADALLQAAEMHFATMIVIGNNGESALRAAVVGAVPHKLLHSSRWPVLCVPAPE